MNRLRIADYYVHQGNQYEFAKTGHIYCLTGMNGQSPDWNNDHRPLLPNIILSQESKITRMKFDIVMIRSPLNMKRYKPYLKNGAKGIAVVQTTTPFPVPGPVKHIVWNSYQVMKECSSFYKGKTHHYIPHGFDPKEFKPLGVDKNNKILTVANAFKSRGDLLGYPLWDWIDQKTGACEVWGHGNGDMKRGIRRADSLEELIRVYNSYSAYFNPTISSAMPRSRGEAAMCGLPIVSTNNYDIGMYFKNGENGFISNNREELLLYLNKLISDKSLAEDMGSLARETAIKHFHIKDNIEKWNHVFDQV
jgi:glycosyltransferase involved in cell wall biosynthesis